MTLKLQIALPPKLIEVFSGTADVRGAYGGRGSGKTKFCRMSAVRAMMFARPGTAGVIRCAVGGFRIRWLIRRCRGQTGDSVEQAGAVFRRSAGELHLPHRKVRTGVYVFAGLQTQHRLSIKSTGTVLLVLGRQDGASHRFVGSPDSNALREEDSELW